MLRIAITAICALGFGLGTGYWLGGRGNKDVRECSEETASQGTVGVREQEQYEQYDEDQPLPTRTREPSAAVPANEATPATSANNPPQPAASARGPMEWRPKPEHRKTMVRQQYGWLLRDLELSESQTEALLDVLATQAERSDSAPVGRAGRWRMDSRNMTPEAREQIAAAIGEEKAAQFDKLSKTVPARMSLAMARDQLERSGDPLTDDQNKALLDKARDWEPATPPAFVEGESPEETSARMRRFMREERQSFRAQAASVLTPTQLKRLEEIDAMQEDMRSRFSGRNSAMNLPTAGRGATNR